MSANLADLSKVSNSYDKFRQTVGEILGNDCAERLFPWGKGQNFSQELPQWSSRYYGVDEAITRSGKFH
jgi:hypothetical protein